jgi:hypothetical protein
MSPDANGADLALFGTVVSCAPLRHDGAAARSIQDLATIDIEYVEDGASDATITENTDPRVKTIVDRAEGALPSLAECLTDRRDTSATVVVTRSGTTRRVPVPLGYLCLDILTAITEGAEVYPPDCHDDGLGACVGEEYFFRPDVYATDPSGSAAIRKVKAVQTKWREAIQAGKVKFRYPSWWTHANQ